ncbi:MAG: MBL fold metallo-hydrolase, partial [Gemmatimonadota bacterium]
MTSTPALEVHPLTVGPLQSNCYLVRAEGAGRAVVVDPGAEARRILDALGSRDVELEAILLTHAHLD